LIGLNEAVNTLREVGFEGVRAGAFDDVDEATRHEHDFGEVLEQVR